MESGKCPRGRFYTVRQGENMRVIADRFGIGIDALIEANPLIHPARCLPGQVLILPDCPDNIRHTVRAGETLADIMRRCDVSAADIRSMNPEVNVFELRAGDELVLPGWSGRAGGGYIMQRGETLASVARKFSADMMSILKCNPNLLPSEYMPGQRIFLP